MTNPGMATHVGVVETEIRRLRRLDVTVAEHFKMIRSTRVDALFTNATEAAAESAALAKPLTKVSEQLALQEKAARAGNRSASAEQLTPSLSLSEEQSDDLLQDLRRNGSALRSRLTD